MHFFKWCLVCKRLSRVTDKERGQKERLLCGECKSPFCGVVKVDA